jgi:nitrite reductase/ring-hydroxylating ferredoxin subunit
MKYRLVEVDDMAAGEVRPVEAGNLGLLIFKTLSGEVRAMRDRCPHQGARLSRGYVLRHVEAESDDGGYALNDQEIVLRCPWHGMEFKAATGVCPADETYRVASVKVTVEDGCVVMERR